MILEGQQGLAQIGDGVTAPLRLGKFREMITGMMAGQYFELARQGRLFMASMQAGASLGTALTATAVTFTLYNPPGSGVYVSLLQCGVTITTEATVAVGAKAVLVYAANVNPAAAVPASVTELVVRPGLLGGPSSNMARAYSAATLPAIPVVVRTHPTAFNNQTAVGDSPLSQMDHVNGSICLMPNAAVTIQGIATASSGIISMVWGEIPV